MPPIILRMPRLLCFFRQGSSVFVDQHRIRGNLHFAGDEAQVVHGAVLDAHHLRQYTYMSQPLW